jgi:membrane protein DedA with SNARE-associated domain
VLSAAHQPHLPGVLHSVAPLINHYGYAAVALFVMLEDFGVPTPGETVLVAAAVYAGAGQLNVVVVGVLAVAAAIVGDNIGFAIGTFGGRRLLDRYGKYVLLTPERVDKAEDFFNRHGGWVVAAARFIEGLRQANGIIAGMSDMTWWKFLPYNALGAVLWVAVWLTIGYTAGSKLDTIYKEGARYQVYLLVAVVVLLAAFILRVVLRRRRRRRRAEPARSATAERGETGS